MENDLEGGMSGLNITLPLVIRLSSVGTLLCISLQTKSDLEGGMSGLNITLAQLMFCLVPYLNSKASLKERSMLLLFFQTCLSSEASKGMVTCSARCFTSGKDTLFMKNMQTFSHNMF